MDWYYGDNFQQSCFSIYFLVVIHLARMGWYQVGNRQNRLYIVLIKTELKRTCSAMDKSAGSFLDRFF